MVAIDLALLEHIATARRFERRTLEIAKRLFIHGETPKGLSVEYGVNVQRVYAIKREVLAAAESAVLPDGWIEVTLKGPKDLVALFEREFDIALRKRSTELAEGEGS